jgi:hypothetical protein
VAENLGSVLLSLGVDLDDFNSGLQQAQKLATTAGKSISDRLDVRRATLSGLQQQLTMLESKLKSNPWSAAALEAPIKALQAEIALRKESISLLEKQIKTQGQIRQGPGGGNGSEFVQGAIGALPGIGGLAGLGPAAAGVAAATAGVAAIKAANDFQKLNQQLNLLTGSAIDTQNALVALKQYAAATPFDLPGLAENAKLLLAFGLSTEQAVEFTKRLGDIATVTGTPLDRLALNLGQIVSLGKAYTVDLRQFALAGIPVFESLSKVTGKSIETLKGLGAIPADDVIAAFRLMTDEGGKFFQGGEKGGTKLDATLATLGESLTLLGVTIGKILNPTVLGAIESANQSVTGIGKRLDQIATIGEIPVLKQIMEFANRFGPAFALKVLTGTYAFDIADAIAGPPKPTGPATPKVDPRTVAKRQQEAAQKAAQAFTAAAKDQATAEGEIVAPARERLQILQATAGLSGLDLELAQQALSVQQARNAEAKAELKYKEALKNANGNERDSDVIKAAASLEAAGLSVQEALFRGGTAISDKMKEGGQKAAEAVKGAAERLKSAGDSLRSALEGSFKFLTPEIQGRLTALAQKDIIAAQQAGIFRADVGLGASPEELLSIAGSARGALGATKAFDVAAKELGTAVDGLKSPLITLAEKDWRVTVNIGNTALAQASVSGAILGG